MKKLLGTLLVAALLVSSLSACARDYAESEAPTETSSSTSEKSDKSSYADIVEKYSTKNDTEESEEPEKVVSEAEAPADTQISHEAAEENAEVTEENAHSNEELVAEAEEMVASHSGNGNSAVRALANLLTGNSSYLTGNLTGNISADRRQDLTDNGQHPYAVVITCSDSRVPPELIFDSSLGDIFVIRTAGNVVSDFEIGSAEYGAEHLGSPLIFVLGHTNCGAVTAATEGGEAGGNIQAIVDSIVPAVNEARQSLSDEAHVLSKAIELNVNNSINKLKGSHIIQELMEEGKVEIIGGVYDITTGNIKILN